MSRARGRALWLPDVLRDAGLPIDVVPGWERRGKEPREWVAQVNHHTASSRRGGPRASLSTVVHGRPGLPGPLCNTLPDRNGTIVIVASGAANHPGVSWIPQRGGISAGVKYWTLGHEIELDGVGEPFPVDGRLYEHVARMNAAIAVYLGHTPDPDLLDHKEIARPRGRKIDVRPYDLSHARTVVARLMTGRTPTTEEPLMVTDTDVARIRRIVAEEVGALLDRTRAACVRDPRTHRAWIITPVGRWHVPSRQALDALIWMGQVATLPDGSIPVADVDWLDQIPVIDHFDDAA